MFYWRSSLWSSDLLLFHLRGLFPSLSVATAILDSSSLLCPPSRPIPRDLYQRGVGRNQRREDTRRRAPQCAGERERELPLAPLFICFSLPGPVLCKLGQPGVLFVLPEILTPVLGPRTFFCFIFAGFSLPCLWPPPFWTPFPYSTYLTSLNRRQDATECFQN